METRRQPSRPSSDAYRPEPTARLAQVGPAAPWRLMLFVVTKEGAKAKTKAKDTDRSKTEKTNCFYCGKLGPRKSECWKLTADKTKSIPEEKPHNINEVGATGSGSPPTTTQHVSALTVSRRDAEEQAVEQDKRSNCHRAMDKRH